MEGPWFDDDDTPASGLARGGRDRAAGVDGPCYPRLGEKSSYFWVGRVAPGPIPAFACAPEAISCAQEKAGRSNPELPFAHPKFPCVHPGLSSVQTRLSSAQATSSRAHPKASFGLENTGYPNAGSSFSKTCVNCCRRKRGTAAPSRASDAPAAGDYHVCGFPLIWAPSMNQLFYGDERGLLREHLKGETVDLMNLDPPFNSNQLFDSAF